MSWPTSESLKWDAKSSLLTHSANTCAIPAFSEAPTDFHFTHLDDAAKHYAPLFKDQPSARQR